MNGLIGLGAGFFIPLVPTWLFLKFGVPDTFSGPLLAVSNITIGLATVVSAALSRRYGPVRAIVMAQGLAIGFMLSLAFAGNPILAGGFLLGIRQFEIPFLIAAAFYITSIVLFYRLFRDVRPAAASISSPVHP